MKLLFRRLQPALFCLAAIGCASAPPRIHESPGTRIVAETDHGFIIEQVAVDSLSPDTANLRCVVRTGGRRIHGHLDIVATGPAGDTTFTKGIAPRYRSRKQSSVNATGFPFACTLPLAAVRNGTVRLSVHREDADVGPDCPLNAGTR